ncbi:MAG: hypothetical protein ACREB8_15860 [Pseudolabrys sp.]
MHRVWDYIGFAVWFAGLGYIVMWLLNSPDLVLLPPALHALGVASAMFVPVRLLVRAIRHRRSGQVAPSARKPAAVLRPPRRKPAYPMRSVKPRKHFGLRGAPD